MSKYNFFIMKYGQQLPPTVLGLAKVAIFTTNVDAEHKTFSFLRNCLQSTKPRLFQMCC